MFSAQELRNAAAAVVTAVATTTATGNQPLNSSAPDSTNQRDAWVAAVAQAVDTSRAGAQRQPAAGQSQQQPATSTNDPFRRGIQEMVRPASPATPAAVNPATPSQPQSGGVSVPTQSASAQRDLNTLSQTELVTLARSLQSDVATMRRDAIVAERLRTVYDGLSGRSPEQQRTFLQETHRRLMERQQTLEGIPLEGTVTLDAGVTARIDALSRSAEQLQVNVTTSRTNFDRNLDSITTSMESTLAQLNQERGARLKSKTNIAPLAEAAAGAGMRYDSASHTYTADPSRGPTFTDPAQLPEVQAALAFRDRAAIEQALRAGTHVEFTSDMPRETLVGHIGRLRSDVSTYRDSLAFSQESLRLAQRDTRIDGGTNSLMRQLEPAVVRVAQREVELESRNRLPIGEGQGQHANAQGARLQAVESIIQSGQNAANRAMDANYQELNDAHHRFHTVAGFEMQQLGSSQRVVERNGDSPLPTRINLGSILGGVINDTVRDVVGDKPKPTGGEVAVTNGRGDASQDVADFRIAVRRQVGLVTAPAPSSQPSAR